MNTPYEILLRSKDGVYRGAHAIDTPGGTPRPITATDWPDVCAAINAASFATIADLQAKVDGAAADKATAVKAVTDVAAAAKAAADAMASDYASYKTSANGFIAQAANILQSVADPATQLTQLNALLVTIQTPELVRQEAALRAQAADAQAKADALAAQIAAATPPPTDGEPSPTP